MTELRYRIVDVFSDRPLAGNGLCVVLDPCPDGLCQALAREVNLSETTFPQITGTGRYDVRIFTPDSELPFAGHPTLGTAWALGPGSWLQTSPGITVEVEADTVGAVMTQPDPEFDDVDAPDLVAAAGVGGALGVWRARAAGLVHLIVATDSDIGQITPDQGALLAAAERAGGQGAAVVRALDDRTLHARVFFPGVGISEDPGTGSAAGPIGLLARRVWGVEEDLTIRQGDEVRRPCRIVVHAEPGDLRVGGAVAACAEGTFSL